MDSLLRSQKSWIMIKMRLELETLNLTLDQTFSHISELLNLTLDQSYIRVVPMKEDRKQVVVVDPITNPH